MSSQAERIKAFKLAQHTRIQKQDEEEQWISSEELCTEGSSDEETQVSVKTSQRKPKRNIRTEKRGVSPLAQPPKVTELTSTYQSDSKYLLPDLYTTRNVVENEINNLPKSVELENFDLLNYEAQYSAACSSNHDLVDLDDEKEMEKMIQWRPKRGSIKLPDMEEARSSALNHEIFENNAFYTEMSINMNALKRSFNKRRARKLEIDDALVLNTPISINGNGKGDSKANGLWRSISELDLEISDTNIKFETEKLERRVIEWELCNSTTDFEVSQTHSKMFQDFVQLCNFQSASEDREIAEAYEDKCNIEEVKTKAKANQDNKFVKRNIELAKQHNLMGQVSLTDEEKLKLDDLLSDLNSEEYEDLTAQNKDMSEKKNDKVKTIEEIKVNYFKLKDEEESVMKELNSKLNDILKSYENLQSGVQNKTSPSTSDGDKVMESDEKEGKLWKHNQIELRLQKIDQDLADISAIDLEEKQKLKQKLIDENAQEQLEVGEKM